MKTMGEAGEHRRFERDQGLPKLVIDFPLGRKNNFARRCRYWVLDRTCSERMPEQLPLVRGYVDPDFWINAFESDFTFLDAARHWGPKADRIAAVQLMRLQRRGDRSLRQLDRDLDMVMLRDGADDP